MKPATESLIPPEPFVPSQAPQSTSQSTTAVQRITLKVRHGPAKGVPSSGPVPLHLGTLARTLSTPVVFKWSNQSEDSPL